MSDSVMTELGTAQSSGYPSQPMRVTFTTFPRMADD
jgi:hypothetical protein